MTPLVADNETVNVATVVPASPSASDTSLTETAGGTSSLVMVPTPCASAIVALVGALRSTVKVSGASNFASPFTRTTTCCAVVPGANVTVPLPAR